MEDLQAQDRKQTEYELEQIFDRLEDGQPLTFSEIDLLRWATGLPKIERNRTMENLFNEFNKIFGEKSC